jgi:hypothetical protein
MAKVDTVYIHIDNDDMHAEAAVPPHTVAGYVANGWSEGPLPENQAARDQERDELIAASRANAEVTAAEQERAAAELATAQSGSVPPAPPAPPAVDVATSGTPVARPQGASEPTPSGANTDPKEG